MAAKPALGIYLTDTFIQASKLSSDGTKLTLFIEEFLPPGMIENGQVKDPKVFTAFLKQFISKSPITIKSGEPVVLGINDRHVFLREFSLPRIPGKEVEGAIEYQIHSLLPILPSEVETDWQIIGRDSDGKIEVLMVAIPKSIINSYVEAIEAIGLKVIAIEPAAFGYIRVLKSENLKNKNQLLVHIGSDFAEFSYITNGNPRFSDYLTETEVQKKGDILKAINEYINYSNTKHPTRPIQEVLVSGNHVNLANVVSHLNAQRFPASLTQSRITQSAIKESLLHTSHGLALKPLEVSKTVNLLPVENRLIDRRNHIYSLWTSILIFMLTISLFAILALIINLQNLTIAQAELLSQKTTLEESLPTTQKNDFIKRVQTTNSIIDKLNVLAVTTGNEDRILDSIAASTPEGVSLSSLVVNRDVKSTHLLDDLSTWIIAGNANSRDQVLNFYEKLIAQPGFKTGKLFFGSLEKESSVTFRIAGGPTPK